MSETVDRWLGSLESEELLTVERELEQLVSMPGWRTLERLLQIRAMSSQSQMANRVLEHAEYAREGGILHGLMQPAKIIKQVKDTARRVEDALAREAAAERRAQEEDVDV